MKNELEAAFSSRLTLQEDIGREQIAALVNFEGGLMCPDKVSRYEPIRTPFNPLEMHEPVRWLTQPQGALLYRKGRPVHLTGEMWNRTLPPSSPFPSPLFSNYWTARFDGEWASRIGIEKVENFVLDMFYVTDSDFALLTSTVDRKAKNQGAGSYSYLGTDLGHGIPGIYWINLFSDELARWLGLINFPTELGVLQRLENSGWLLKFGESPDHCRDLDVLQKQRATIEWLGSRRFFDIRFPDRKLETPDWNPKPSVENLGADSKPGDRRT